MTRFEELEETHAEVKLRQSLWQTQKDWENEYVNWMEVCMHHFMCKRRKCEGTNLDWCTPILTMQLCTITEICHVYIAQEHGVIYMLYIGET